MLQYALYLCRYIHVYCNGTHCTVSLCHPSSSPPPQLPNKWSHHHACMECWHHCTIYKLTKYLNTSVYVDLLVTVFKMSCTSHEQMEHNTSSTRNDYWGVYTVWIIFQQKTPGEFTGKLNLESGWIFVILSILRLITFGFDHGLPTLNIIYIGTHFWAILRAIAKIVKYNFHWPWTSPLQEY